MVTGARKAKTDVVKHGTLALPNSTQYSYIALTGEHCVIKDVSVDKTEELIEEDYIERIAPLVSYIDRIEDGTVRISICSLRRTG